MEDCLEKALNPCSQQEYLARCHFCLFTSFPLCTAGIQYNNVGGPGPLFLTAKAHSLSDQKKPENKISVILLNLKIGVLWA